MERAAHAELHGLARSAGSRLLDEAVDRRVLARDDDLAWAVVVRGPHAVDGEAASTTASSRPSTAAIAPGVSRAAPRPRLAALTDERDGVASADRIRRRERRVLADRVADHVVRLDPQRLDGAKTRDRGGTSAGCWSSVRVSSSSDPSKQSFATSKPTASRPRRTPPAPPETLRDGAAHAHVLRSLAGEAECDLHGSSPTLRRSVVHVR